MFFYIVIFIFLFFFAFIDNCFRLKSKARISIVFIILFLFFVLSILRWERGTDWISYHDFFSHNHSLVQFKSRLFEPGYTYLAYLIKNISINFTFFLFINALIIYSLKFYIFKKLTPLPLISLLVYYVLQRGDIFFTRESIALSILMFSILFIIRRQLFPFILCLISALFFHWSSLIFVFAYPIYSLKFNNYKFILLLFCVSLISLFLGEFLLTLISKSLGGAYAWKFHNYLTRGGDQNYGTGLSQVRMIIQSTINRSIFLFMFLVFLNKTRRSDLIVNGLINIYALSLIIFFMTASISNALVRLADSYELISCLLFGYLIFYQKLNNRVILSFFLGFYFFVRFYSSTLSGGYKDYFIPYKSIFNKEMVVKVG